MSSVIVDLENILKSKHTCLLQHPSYNDLIKDLAERQQDVEKLQNDINEMQRAIEILKGAGL